MILEHLVVGPFAVNCYILGCDKTHEAVVIDPGDESIQILKILKDKELTPKYWLLTHGHIDHVLALKELEDNFVAAALMHQKDYVLIENLSMQAEAFGLSCDRVPKIAGFIEEGDVVRFGTLSLHILHTPGHSLGGVCFLSEEEVFVGDTLFAGSIGRTDLFGGSYELLLQSVRSKLFTLSDETKVYPGHGPFTTIGEEKSHNPFFK